MRHDQKKKVNPIDVEIGGRVRAARVAAGFSQEKLGEALGITFQQIQKYEKGVNRIGGSRMQAISKALRVPVSHFFAPEIETDDDILGPLVGLSTFDIALAQAIADLPDDAKNGIWKVVQAVASVTGRRDIPVEKTPAVRRDGISRGDLERFVQSEGLARV